jgi:DNA-directed RNA polymerase subunit M/transcription elongation factor TFIIS
MTHVLELTCPVCDSTEVMTGEPSENFDEEITVTCVSLVCGHFWEE